MEALTAATSTSVLAVGSIAIQRAENSRKLHDFWDLVEDAPQEVRTMVQDLRFSKGFSTTYEIANALMDRMR